LSFTVEYLEYALLVIVRISAIIFVAPVFNNRNIPVKVKVGISVFLGLIIMNLVDYTAVSYEGVLGYSILVVKEAITGILIGMGSGFCLYILSFSGHMIDMEIGFAMAMEMDPTTQVQTTITSTFFSAIFLLMFLASDMHYFVIDALVDSYDLIPIGGAVLQPSLYQIFLKFITDYFIIGFRIILPVFACILIVNVVLGILAKVAPQMNMFVIGMQIKVFAGLALLTIVMFLFPGVVDFLFEEMQLFTKYLTESMIS